MTTSNEWTTEVNTLIDTWTKRARLSQHSHHDAGKYYKKLHLFLGLPSALISGAIAAMAVFYLNSTVSKDIVLVIGLSGMLVAILNTLQTFLRFNERGVAHENVGARYGSIRRELELITSLPTSARGDVKAITGRIKEKLDSLGEQGPVVKDRLFNTTKNRLENTSSSFEEN